MSDLGSATPSFIARHEGCAWPRTDDAELSWYSHQGVASQLDFTPGASGDPFPAARYGVDTGVERPGDGARVLASAVLLVPAGGSRIHPIQVQARALDATSEAGAKRQELATPSENPDRGEAPKAATGTLGPEAVQSHRGRFGTAQVAADPFAGQGSRDTNASDAITAAMRAKRT